MVIFKTEIVGNQNKEYMSNLFFTSYYSPFEFYYNNNPCPLLSGPKKNTLPLLPWDRTLSSVAFSVMIKPFYFVVFIRIRNILLGQTILLFPCLQDLMAKVLAASKNKWWPVHTCSYDMAVRTWYSDPLAPLPLPWKKKTLTTSPEKMSDKSQPSDCKIVLQLSFCK